MLWPPPEPAPHDLVLIRTATAKQRENYATYRCESHPRILG
jgi:hypothetical protein